MSVDTKQVRYLNFFFSLIIILLAVFSCISYFQIDKFLNENQSVAHTYKVIGKTNNILLDILDMESVTRGYIISGDDSFLNNFHHKKNKILNDFILTKELTKDNPQQQKLLEDVDPLLQDRIKTLEQLIQYSKLNKANKTKISNLVHHGQALTTEIKSIIKEIHQAEITLLEKRETNTLENFNDTISITTLATIILLIFMATILILFNCLLSNFKNININLEYETKEMSLINEMNNLLVNTDSIKEALYIFSNYLKKILPFTAGAIYLLKTSGNYLEVASEWNKPEIPESVFSPNQCLALRQGKAHIYYNKDESVDCEHQERKTQVSPYMCIPLIAQNEIIGVLYIELHPINDESQIEIKHRVNHNQLLIKNLSRQIALSLSHIKLHDALKTRSTRDPLTNLYNRSYITDTLEREIHRAKRKQISMAIIMMDLDFFKNINDTYGHEAGDVVLKKIGMLLSDNIRHSDIACRYGGEEFLIIFYDTNLENTLSRVEQLRKMISKLKFNFQGIINSISASFGVAMYSGQDEEDVEALIKSADEALYQSKLDGRNKVTVYQKPLE